MLRAVLHMAAIKSHFPFNASELSWELCFWIVLLSHLSQTSTPTDFELNTRALMMHRSISECGVYIYVCFFLPSLIQFAVCFPDYKGQKCLRDEIQIQIWWFLLFRPQLLPLCSWTVLEGKHLDPFYLSVIHGTRLLRSLLSQSHWGGTQIRLFFSGLRPCSKGSVFKTHMS